MRFSHTWWCFATLVTGIALAQAPVYVPTGTLDADIDGGVVVFRTHANLVPEPGSVVADAAAADLVETLSGREVNTASFVYVDAMVVGGVTALPASLTVVLRGAIDPGSRDDRRELVVSFGLDPVTLAWDAREERVAVAYHPERWSASAYYQVLELHAFELTLVEAERTHVLRVAGRLEATLAWRQGAFQVTVDPTNTVALAVDFVAFPVVGDDVLVPLLDGATDGR
jgi:hypothetical protein